jgi:hypothetical protein
MPYTIVYDWEDLDASKAINEPEQKFGDHFSEAETLEQALEETRKYVRGSLGRQKHKFDEGRVILHKMWDASHYAKIHNRFGKHQKVDDLIRPVIGYHVQADVHRIDADTLIERVNRELIKYGQKQDLARINIMLPKMSLPQLQKVNELLLQNFALDLAKQFGAVQWSVKLVLN